MRERNREIEEGVFTAKDDPRHPLVAPHAETVPPHLNFAPLENAAEELTRSATEYHKAFEQAAANGGSRVGSGPPAGAKPFVAENARQFTTCQGVAQRAWGKHPPCSPGRYTCIPGKTPSPLPEGTAQK